MPRKGSGRKAATLRRWLPTLELLAAQERIVSLDAFVDEHARPLFDSSDRRKPLRMLKDELRGLVAPHIEQDRHGVVVKSTIAKAVADARVFVGRSGLRLKGSAPERPAATDTTSPAGAPAQGAPDMSPAKQPQQATQLFRFHITPSEALLIITHLVVEGGLVAEIVSGRSKLGVRLWDALSAGGYVKPKGKFGPLTPAKVDVDLFSSTRFLRCSEGKKQFKGRYKRPGDLRDGEQAQVPPNQFLKTLTEIAKEANEADEAAGDADAAAATNVTAEAASSPEAAADVQGGSVQVPEAPAEGDNVGVVSPVIALLEEELKELRREADELQLAQDTTAAELRRVEDLRAKLERELGRAEGRRRAVDDNIIRIIEILRRFHTGK